MSERGLAENIDRSDQDVSDKLGTPGIQPLFISRASSGWVESVKGVPAREKVRFAARATRCGGQRWRGGKGRATRRICGRGFWRRVDGGMAARVAAKVFRISVSYIYNALIRRRCTGQTGAGARRGHRATADHIAPLLNQTSCSANSQACNAFSVKSGCASIWAAKAASCTGDSLRGRLGLSFKKTLRASEQRRPDVAARRRIWRAARPFVDADKLVFIDETGANTKMTRLYGRAPKGRRLFARRRSAIGKPPPSSPHCVAMGSAYRWCSMGR